MALPRKGGEKQGKHEQQLSTPTLLRLQSSASLIGTSCSESPRTPQRVGREMGGTQTGALPDWPSPAWPAQMTAFCTCPPGVRQGGVLGGSGW